MKTPSGTAPNLVEVNGKGKLFIQTLLPAGAEVKLNTGKNLYAYNGSEGPVAPARLPDPASANIPECRLEVSPKSAAATDYFLHVLTTGDENAAQPPLPDCKVTGSEVALTIGTTHLHFKTGSVGGAIEIGGSKFELASRIAIQPLPPVHAASSLAAANAPADTAASPAKPKDEISGDDKAAAEKRYAELKTAVIQGASSGKKMPAVVDLYGAPTDVKVAGADEKALAVAVEGLPDSIKIPWEKIDAAHFYQVARRYSDDHKALFDYCVGSGLRKEADIEASKR